MKLKVLLLLLISFQSYSQVSVGAKHVGKSSKFKKGVLENFKNTQTIFLLSSIYEKEVYEKILKDSWDVTPYKIVSADDFIFEDYLSDKYSIAQLAGLKKIKKSSSGMTSTSLLTYIDIKIYDSKTILEKLKNINKNSSEKTNKKRSNIIAKNSSNIARFHIYAKDDFTYTALSKEIDEIVHSLFTEDVFFNYTPGLLKNYFQKINNLLKTEEIYWMYEDDYLPELKQLANNKLYVPKYISAEYNAWMSKDKDEDDTYIHEIFKKYDYQYEIIPDDILSQKIIDNEEFYYLRYVRVNNELFLQVVNSKTGEIIFRNYMPGFLSFNLKTKHIKGLNSKIAKALKK